MISIQMPGPDDGAQLVNALLIASGTVPATKDPSERQGFLDLAHELGDGLDRLPAPPEGRT